MSRPKKLQETRKITPTQRKVLTSYYGLNRLARSATLMPYRRRYNLNIRNIQRTYDDRVANTKKIQKAFRDLRQRRIDTAGLEGNVRERIAQPRTMIPLSKPQTISNFIIGNLINPLGQQNLLITATFLVKGSQGMYYNRRKIYDGLYTRGTRDSVIQQIIENLNKLRQETFQETSESDASFQNVKIVSTFRNDLQGGCGGRNCKYGSNMKVGNWTCFSPKGLEKTNNCFFKCLDVNPIQVRKELNIPRGEKINIDTIPRIAEYLKIKIIVYDGLQRKLIECGCSYELTFELVLIHEHYLLVKEKQKRCPDCYKYYMKEHTCNHSSLCFIAKKKGQGAVSPQNKKIKDSAPDYDQIIYFDFETFTPHKEFEVYASGYYNLETQQADRFYGKNSLTKFVEYINKQENKIFIAHNGSRFDNYFLINEMIKQNIKPEKILCNNGAYMSFEFGTNKVIDSINFLSCSLGDAGKSFNIPPEFWKSEFNHNKIKTWEDTEKYKDEVIAYLDLDVLCLKKVWEKFSTKIYDNFKIHTHDFITTSSMAYCIWVNSNKDMIYLPTEKELEFIKRSTYGANVYPVKRHFKSQEYEKVMNGELKYEDVNDYLKIMDVVSLYPTSMTNEFPVGKPRWTKDINDTEKMGIWEINFKPRKDLIVSQLPRKVNGGIIHSLEDGTGVYNSIDIDRAKDAGYEIEYLNGLVWDSTSKVFANYVNNGFQLKNKAREDNDEVMYAISKLLLNGLYGKTLQRPIYLETKILTNYKDAIKFINTHEEMNEIVILNENAVLYSGNIKQEKKQTAITKPTQLGSFVLGYSRSIMYNIQKSIDPSLTQPVFYYTDTDCFHVHSKDLPKLDKFMGDNLGQLNSDLKNEGIILEGIYLAPKQYSVCYIDNKNQILNKNKCKGISKKYLESQFYQNALKGKSTEVKMIDRFKKIAFKQNSKQLDYSKFSVHLEDIDRTFYKNEWNGRIWSGNDSVPIGYLGED